jgi:hypothetical protein
MGVWMETLKLLVQREAAAAAAAGEGGDDGAGAGAAPRAGSPAAGMAGVLAYTALRNPPAVENAISEQRQERGAAGARALVLCRMGLVRWPLGVSDRTSGRPPWVALQTVTPPPPSCSPFPRCFSIALGFFQSFNLTLPLPPLAPRSRLCDNTSDSTSFTAVLLFVYALLHTPLALANTRVRACYGLDGV